MGLPVIASHPMPDRAALLVLSPLTPRPGEQLPANMRHNTAFLNALGPPERLGPPTNGVAP
ncbi:hypothetical protein [Streptomyces sp. NPDC051662]|uniref:hypothetical protein n=1 Tax=Streptomyces sp. NPDC051662 TaxID=3154750 RepID=UPI003426F9D8